MNPSQGEIRVLGALAITSQKALPPIDSAKPFDEAFVEGEVSATEPNGRWADVMIQFSVEFKAQFPAVKTHGRKRRAAV
jgi:hypothetical protein